MEEKNIVRMNKKELSRLKVIGEVMAKRITQRKASEIIALSERQVRRIVKKVRIEGEAGIAHHLRDKPSVKKIPEELKDKVISLYQKKYLGFGPTLACEELLKNKVNISKETLRKWLIEEHFWERVHKRRKHRRWRERKEYFGQMVQMDGSHHDWLEGRGRELVLMAYIDDATSTVFAHFYDYEGTIPAMESFKGYIEQYGLPQSVYLDRHTTYKSNGKLTTEEALKGLKEPQSQFERALDELGVDVIHAYSPQAKGRIERLFRTLQDRLIKKMRLAGVSSKEEANHFLKEYLSDYNQRFSIAPAKKVNIHREIPKGINLDSILSIKIKRTLRNDFTINYHNQLYQIENTPPNIRIKGVMVEERIDKTIHITYNGIELKYKKIDIKSLKLKEQESIQSRKIRIYIPPPDHPWRKFKINPYKQKRKKIV
jgi:hypothetical protein